MNTDRAAWRKLAACVGADPEMFFPEPSDHAKRAKRICAGCPVRVQCLNWQLDHERAHPTTRLHGIFGGKSGRERQDILKAERKQARAAA